jgi:glutamyl-tRNA synthetase
VVAGAIDKQLADMRTLGLTADQVLVQSQARGRHEALFRQAVSTGAVYPCFCSRKEVLENLRQMASAPHEQGGAPIYDGRCRSPERRGQGAASAQTQTRAREAIAWRFCNPLDPSGAQDFIVARAKPDLSDFVPSYHWACAIDDFDGAHRLLVRAWDLEHVIALQRLIHAWVGKVSGGSRPYPAVFHASLVVANDGHRLEKRTRGVTLDELFAAGWSAEKILGKFQESFIFTHPETLQPGAVLGETAREVKLEELGF